MILKRPSFGILAIGLLVAALLLLIACTPSHPQSTFDSAGPVAEKQKILFYIIFWAAIFVFVLVVGILLYAVIHFRRRPGREGMPAQTHGNTPLEIGWTVAPALVLAVIAVPTIIYIFQIAESPGADALEVNVTGHQWWWEFEYPEQDVVTANELHVPVNRYVKLNLMSDDVIHSFWAPKLAGKVDVIPQPASALGEAPRNVNKMKFKADRVGEFFGQCAEYCGEAHAHMRFHVIVEEQDKFDAWVDNYHELAKGPAPPTEAAAKGAALFPALGCSLCHWVNGPPPPGLTDGLMSAWRTAIDQGGTPLTYPGPNLTNFGSRTTLAAGRLDNDRDGENLMKWLRDPEKVKPGNRMAEVAQAYNDPEVIAKLTDENIAALVAYLLSLR